MDLLTLNLRGRLAWSRDMAAGVSSLSSALATAVSAPEGAEIVLRWGWDDVIRATADGPKARLPFPEPAFIAASGLGSPLVAAVDECLEPGRYLFAQARPGGMAAVEGLVSLVEWFAREAWWTRVETAGPFLIRLVREDGKTAMQAIRRLAPSD